MQSQLDFSLKGPFIFCAVLLLLFNGCNTDFRSSDEPKAQVDVSSLELELASYWPLVVGSRRRYAIQSTAMGKGVVEEQFVEETTVDGQPVHRLRAHHRYDSGRAGIEELYVRQCRGHMVIVGRMTSAADFGIYAPPMAVFAAPTTSSTVWSGSSQLTETAKTGMVREAVTVPWSGAILDRETVTVPAGRFENCVKVENRAAGRYVTHEWLAATVGVVRREVRQAGQLVVLQELILAY